MEEHEELVWLAGNLKLEVTEYSKQIYGLIGFAQPRDNDNDDDVDDDDNGDDPEATASYRLRKRHY